ncbi:cation-translocating P-type ATPase [bacterium]|nr:cation-translocating P-type ATPase [bacterium]
MKNQPACKLCGLPVKELRLNPDPGKDRFCCNGCRMVYSMLMESDQFKNETDFTQTDLYKRCVAAGIIPDTSRIQPESSTPGMTATDAGTSSQRAYSPEPAEKVPDETLTCSFTVGNMWCPACAWIVEDALRKTKGVVQASCNFSSDRGKVLYDPVKTKPDTLLKVVENLGYSASPLEQSQKRSIREFVRLAVTLFLTMNIMMFSWSIYSGFFWKLSGESVQLLSWPVLIMATVVLVYGGYPIFSRALAGIRAGAPGMETLIATGSLTTYVASLFNVVAGSLHLYFDASAMLILLILIGKRLEQSARDRISAGLADFFSLAPEKVKLCSDQFPNGRYVSVKQLSREDIFLAEQGEILAADGTIVDGAAIIDESSITGEVKPVKGKIYDGVKSGSRIISGKIRVKATQVGSDSVLGKMMAIMENSLSGKTQKTARFEGLLKYFVPTVISLAVLTFLAGFLSGLSNADAFNRAISVLVISCPCALGIAIPLALVAGVSIAGKSGILVRNFEAFEKIETLDCIVFDKTGTLTTGKMQLLEIRTASHFSRDQVLGLASALEAESDHYIAHTLKTHALDNGILPLPVGKIRHYETGIAGEFDGSTIRLGSRDFAGIETTAPMNPADLNAGERQVVTEIFLTVNGTLVATIIFGDTIRSGVRKLIAHLRQMRHIVFLLSGDASAATHAAALSAGIDREQSHGGVLPHEKAAFIRQLQQTGKTVAMVGDGVNDAPAMAESDLAVAVHSGLNPGDGVAAITLMQEDPVQLLNFLHLARLVNRTVKQNLVGALVYNLIGIPVAASGMLNPIIAVTAMLFSSLSVTFNTLFLVRRNVAQFTRGVPQRISVKTESP